MGRNLVAEASILKYWRENVSPRHPHLEITQNDPAALRPRRAGDASGKGPLDFLVRDARTQKLVFGIENKTGRSAIREMSKFQLDVSDCDSILHHVNELAVPAYVIHAQVLEIWEPPTMGFQTIGLWWSDIYTMGEHFKNVLQRRDENRGAAYFDKRAFQDISTFADALADDRGKLALVERYRREGLPAMYHTD